MKKILIMCLSICLVFGAFVYADMPSSSSSVVISENLATVRSVRRQRQRPNYHDRGGFTRHAKRPGDSIKDTRPVERK